MPLQSPEIFFVSSKQYIARLTSRINFQQHLQLCRDVLSMIWRFGVYARRRAPEQQLLLLRPTQRWPWRAHALQPVQLGCFGACALHPVLRRRRQSGRGRWFGPLAAGVVSQAGGGARTSLRGAQSLRFGLPFDRRTLCIIRAFDWAQFSVRYVWIFHCHFDGKLQTWIHSVHFVVYRVFSCKMLYISQIKIKRRFFCTFCWYTLLHKMDATVPIPNKEFSLTTVSCIYQYGFFELRFPLSQFLLAITSGLC